MSNVIHLHETANPARGLHLCLYQLHKEAISLGLPFVAYMIGIASEAARDESLKWNSGGGRNAG